jgi:hypothetical protein
MPTPSNFFISPSVVSTQSSATPADANWSALSAADMGWNVTPLERAFQLAKSGEVSNLDDIRKTLKQEGYDADVGQDGASLKTHSGN